MKVSVLVPTRNRPEFIGRCLASILNNTVQPFEIIAVDQSEDQQTRLIVETLQAEHPHLIYVKDRKPGKSRALNRVAERAGGHFIGITDDDCVVAQNWLETFNAYVATHPDLAAMTGQVRAINEDKGAEILNLVLSEISKIKRDKTNPWRLGAPGGNMFIRKDVFFVVGKFDECMGPGASNMGGVEAAEDADLIYRVLGAKYPVMYNPALIVYHAGWRSREDSYRVRYDYAMGLGAFAGKHLKSGDPYPLFYIGIRFSQKLRRILVGLLLLQKERIRDGYLHIIGISRGFVQRLFL